MPGSSSVFGATCAIGCLVLVAAGGCSGDGGGAGRDGSGGLPGGSGAMTGTGGSATGGFDNNPGGGGVVSSGGVVNRPDAGGPNCNQDVDVVFVLDVSGSMIPPLTRLQEEVAMVDAALQQKNLPGPPHYGLVVFVDDLQVMNGGAPYADVAALRADIMAQIDLTNVAAPRQVDPNILDNYSWPENGLDALYAAATEFQWRPADATLRTLIHITDASFWEGELASSRDGDPMMLEATAANGCSNTLLALATCNTRGSVRTYDEAIMALRERKIWVNTFAARTGGPPGPTLSPPSHGAFRGVDVNVGIGYFEPYDGKPALADATGGNAFDIDEVFDGIISLATPINASIEDSQCEDYPPIPVL